MLKKCIAFAVIFAVAAGAAFAQITFGGQLQEGMTLFSGNNVNDSDVNMGGTYSFTYHEAKFSVLFGDGTAGGRLVWLLNDKMMWGWMQWRPNQFFKVRIGTDGDGEGGFPQIIGWGFTGEAKNSVAAVSDYGQGGVAMDYRNSGLNYGAFDGASSFNLQFTVFPTDMLQVSLLFRGFDSRDTADVKLAKAQIWAAYKLEEIGTIRFAAEGKGGLAKHKDDGGTAKDGDAIGVIHLAFYSNEIVQGLAFEAGGQIDLPHLNESDTFDAIRAAAGFNLTATDPFNLKVRFGSKFGGQTKGVDKEAVGFSVGLLPSYKLPKMTIFFHAGFGYEQANKDKDAVTEWFINPYVWVPMGGMRMWVGLRILDDHLATQDGQIKWDIPFGFNFYF
jgi:hypothetical protein